MHSKEKYVCVLEMKDLNKQQTIQCNSGYCLYGTALYKHGRRRWILGTLAIMYHCPTLVS